MLLLHRPAKTLLHPCCHTTPVLCGHLQSIEVEVVDVFLGNSEEKIISYLLKLGASPSAVTRIRTMAWSATTSG
jgi:hypothetical protein